MDLAAALAPRQHAPGMALRVRAAPATDGFASLPPSVCRALLEQQLGLPLILQLTAPPAEPGAEPRTLHAAWAGGASPEGTLELSPDALACLALHPGTEVRVRALPDAPPAVRVHCTPLHADDWEAASCDAAEVEDRLLQQACAASVGSALPFWPAGRSAPLRLRVTGVEPGVAVVRLVRDTELVVAPVVLAICWSCVSGGLMRLDDDDDEA